MKTHFLTESLFNRLVSKLKHLCDLKRKLWLPNNLLSILCFWKETDIFLFFSPGSPTPNKTKMDAGDVQKVNVCRHSTAGFLKKSSAAAIIYINCDYNLCMQISADVTAVDQDHNVTAKIAEDGINYSRNSSKDSVVNRTKVEREDSINHKAGLNESNSNSHNENVTFVDRKNGTVTDLPTSDPSGHENDTCALLCVFGISLAILALTVLIVVVAIKWKPAKGFRHRYSEQKYMPPVWSLAEAVRECDKNMRINETTNIYWIFWFTA